MPVKGNKLGPKAKKGKKSGTKKDKAGSAKPTAQPSKAALKHAAAQKIEADRALEEWTKLQSPAAPALLQVAARLAAEERDLELCRPVIFSPPPVPHQEFGLSMDDYNSAVAVAKAIALRNEAEKDFRTAQAAADYAHAEYAAAARQQDSRREAAEQYEKQAHELKWPRSESKCRRKGIPYNVKASVSKADRLLVRSSRQRAAFQKQAAPTLELQVKDDMAQMELERAMRVLAASRKAEQEALAALEPAAAHRAVLAGVLTAAQSAV